MIQIFEAYVENTRIGLQYMMYKDACTHTFLLLTVLIFEQIYSLHIVLMFKSIYYQVILTCLHFFDFYFYKTNIILHVYSYDLL